MFTVIPAKPFQQAKTRLAAVLSLAERANLSRHLLQRTIHLAGQVGEVVVISRDAAVRRVAKEAGAWALVEMGAGLNGAVQQASEWVLAQGGQRMLVLPGDLPLVQLADIQAMVALGQSSPALVIAPCQRRDGTNALFLNPPDLIPFAFGPGSFAQHQQAGWARGVIPIIYDSATLALDLDLPGDLEDWFTQADVPGFAPKIMKGL
ncbi:MAG: 2-phospho-L-lactate guanylyltransferase [Anaerolineae bacterium]